VALFRPPPAAAAAAAADARLIPAVQRSDKQESIMKIKTKVRGGAPDSTIGGGGGGRCG